MRLQVGAPLRVRRQRRSNGARVASKSEDDRGWRWPNSLGTALVRGLAGEPRRPKEAIVLVSLMRFEVVRRLASRLACAGVTRVRIEDALAAELAASMPHNR